MADRARSAGPRLTNVLSQWRVPLGFICGAAVLWLAKPTVRSVLVGSAVAVAGELLRIWAAGHLEKGQEVTRSGPYRFIRHPLYVGSTIVGAGAAIAAASVSIAALIAGYLVPTVVAAIRTEEAGMRAAFGDQYDAYVQSRGEPVERSFSLARAMKNKEYRAVAGLAVVAAILAMKATWK
jgi:protein-S-isoprenylcysteine O-methyltransferase Ste14